MTRELLAAIAQINAEKGLTKDEIIETVKTALLSAYHRTFTDTSEDARIDFVSGEFRVFTPKLVMEDEVEDPHRQISLKEARLLSFKVKPGDLIDVETTPHDFGRIAAQTAKQVILQRIREAERDHVFEEYAGREGEIVTGTIQRAEPRGIVIDLGKIEGIMPPTEQVPGEHYRAGSRIRVFLVEIHRSHKGPQALLSRTHRNLVRRLFEREVPEIFSGTVEIKAIAREAGSRSKVAVVSHQEGLDPVGACVGMRGTRINAIISELSGEKIDIVHWNPDPAVFVSNALSPAKAQSVDLNEDDKTASVVVPERQLSLAIGKDGQNARLAAKLTGWRVDIKAPGMERAPRGDEPSAYRTPEPEAMASTPAPREPVVNVPVASPAGTDDAAALIWNMPAVKPVVVDDEGPASHGGAATRKGKNQAAGGKPKAAKPAKRIRVEDVETEPDYDEES